MNNKQEPLAIVVVAYNRAKALAKLLNSLKRVETDINVPLVISIDGGGTEAVNKIANDFEWQYGEKKVIIHERLGLVKHFIWAGDQTETYGNVLFLEDDLYVSPDIINYSQQLISFYKDDERITGGSCYNMPYTLSGMRFYQVQDGYDNYFWQHPYWGNIWFGEQWLLFREYLKTYKENNDLLPTNVQTWTRSFKKIYLQFLVENHKTMVFPRVSLVTNNGIGGGEHNQVDAYQFHVPFNISAGKHYNFSKYDESMARYDVFEEIEVELIKKLCPEIKDYDFTVDTKFNRNTLTTEYLLTTLNSGERILSFDSNMKPSELGVILRIDGTGLNLQKRDDEQYSKSRINNLKYIDIIKNTYRPTIELSLKLLLTSIRAFFARKKRQLFKL